MVKIEDSHEKQSDTEWLGSIPRHWMIKKLGYCISHNDGGVWGEDFSDEGTIVLRSTEISIDGQWQLIDPARRLLSRTERANAMLKKGDLVITKSSGSEAHIGKTAIVTVEIEGMHCAFANFMQRVRVLPHVLPEYMYYFINVIIRPQLSYYGETTTGLRNLNAEAIASFKVLQPPIEEQKMIASFVRSKAEEIDSLVADKERLIALLQEQRQAIITEAVTKGLDPTVPMKDSGVEWIGQVPEHWVTLSLGSLSDKMTNGYVGPTRDIFVENGVRYLQSLHIKQGAINFDRQPYYVNYDWSNRQKKSVLAEDDVLVVQTGDIGQCCVVPEEYAGSNCHALIIIRPRKDMCSGRYLSHYLQSHVGRHQLLKEQTGALHPHLNCGKIKFIPILLPPVTEQVEIVEYIESESRKLTFCIEKTADTILYLRDYRQSLITEAVTGKIDVRGEGVS